MLALRLFLLLVIVTGTAYLLTTNQPWWVDVIFVAMALWTAESFRRQRTGNRHG